MWTGLISGPNLGGDGLPDEVGLRAAGSRRHASEGTLEIFGQVDGGLLYETYGTTYGTVYDWMNAAELCGSARRR